MPLKSRDLMDFLTGPIHTTRNQLLILLTDWQLDIQNRVVAGETVHPSEFVMWQRLMEIVQGLMSSIIYEMTGSDLYTEEKDA